MGMKEDGPKRPNKKLLYYYGIILLITILLNALVMPALAERSVTEVTYDQFLDMLDNKQIAGVTRGDNQLTFWTEDVQQALNGQLPLKSWKTADIKLYKTGLWPDEDLTARLRNAGITFSESIPTQASPLQNFIFNWVLPILMFVVIGQILSKSMAKRMGGMGNAMTFGKSNAKIYAETETGKTFADVAGQEEAKEALKEIVDFLHNPQKYADIGAVLPKGALLVGPPGTGKTLLAKAVAGEAHVPFFSISGSEFVEMFVGMGAAKVRDLFKQANEKAPCIVFIDEIDTIGKKRDGSGFSGNDEREQTLNQLLTEMDGFDGRKGVVILAATNRPESLDKALLRPGRFDRKVAVGRPDVKGREEILKVHSKEKPLSEDVDLHRVAQTTSGFTGADLENLMNEAAIISARENRRFIKQSDIDRAFVKVGIGAEKRSKVISEKDKKITAYHEAGHAILFHVLPDVGPVHTVSIIPTGIGAAGYTMPLPEKDEMFNTKGRMKQNIMVDLGGRIAEELIFDDITTGASQDIKQATQIARAMVTQYGMSEKVGMIDYGSDDDEVFIGRDFGHVRTYSDEVTASIDEEVKRIIDECYDKAKAIILEHRDVLESCTALLIEKEKIGQEEFEALFQK